MMILGYFSAIVFTVAALILAAKARGTSKFATITKAASNNFPPKIEGQSIYTSISCISDPIPNNVLFANHGQVLLARIKINEHKFFANSGSFPIIIDPRNPRNMHQPRGGVHYQHKIQIGFPEQSKFTSDIGTVVANHLDLAIWFGSIFDKSNKLCPNEAAPIIRSLGLLPNFSADYYFIIKEWFPLVKSTKLTIFAEVTKKRDMYEINPPKKLPFIVTTKSPVAFSKEAFNKSIKLGFYAKILIISAFVIALFTYVME